MVKLRNNKTIPSQKSDNVFWLGEEMAKDLIFKPFIFEDFYIYFNHASKSHLSCISITKINPF